MESELNLNDILFFKVNKQISKPTLSIEKHNFTSILFLSIDTLTTVTESKVSVGLSVTFSSCLE